MREECIEPVLDLHQAITVSRVELGAPVQFRWSPLVAARDECYLECQPYLRMCEAGWDNQPYLDWLGVIHSFR